MLMKLDKIISFGLIKSQHFSQYSRKFKCMFALNFFKKLFSNLLIGPDSMKYHLKNGFSKTEHIINVLDSLNVNICVIKFLFNPWRGIHRGSRDKFTSILVLTNRITEITKFIYLLSPFKLDKNIFGF